MACPDDLWPVVDVAERRLRVVMEVTERVVARDPAGLLGAVARARAVGRRSARPAPTAALGVGMRRRRRPGLVVRAAQPLLDKLAPAS